MPDIGMVQACAFRRATAPHQAMAVLRRSTDDPMTGCPTPANRQAPPM